MTNPLSVQKKIDALAALFVFVLVVVIECVFLVALTAATGWWFAVDDASLTEQGTNATTAMLAMFVGSLVLFFPVAVWLGFKIRRWLNWPAGAFESTDRVHD